MFSMQVVCALPLAYTSGKLPFTPTQGERLIMKEQNLRFRFEGEGGGLPGGMGSAKWLLKVLLSS